MKLDFADLLAPFCNSESSLALRQLKKNHILYIKEHSMIKSGFSFKKIPFKIKLPLSIAILRPHSLHNIVSIRYKI